MSWESMFREIVGKENHHHFANHKYSIASVDSNCYQVLRSENAVHYRYYLGKPYANIYFTRREAETLIHLVLGKTLLATARAMSLSPRTIEYYTNNMKHKLQCRRKTELVARVKKAEFIKLALLPLMEAL